MEETGSSIERLREIAARLPMEPVSVQRVASSAAFVSRTRAHFGAVRPKRTLVALVLEGKKEIVHARGRAMLGRGDVLVVPRGVTYDTNVSPGKSAGCFRALCVEVSGEAAAAFARAHPSLSRSAELGAFETDRPHTLRASEATLLAFVHFALTLFSADAAPAIVRHRLEDLVLSLSLQQEPDRAPSSRAADEDLVLATRQLVRGEPSAAWSAVEVARRFAMSASTLRRRLATDGTSLRKIRVEERMDVAAALLARRGSRVADVAARCGYDSPSKFAKQYRERFGKAPREA